MRRAITIRLLLCDIATCQGIGGTVGSTFDRACRDAGNDMLLQREEEDDDRRDAHQQSRERQIPLLRILREERVRGQRNRAQIRVAPDDQERQQEVVPDPERVQDEHGDDHRLEQRHDDSEKDAERRAAVHDARFLDFDRHRFYEAVEQEDGQ